MELLSLHFIALFLEGQNIPKALVASNEQRFPITSLLLVPESGLDSHLGLPFTNIDL